MAALDAALAALGLSDRLGLGGVARVHAARAAEALLDAAIDGDLDGLELQASDLSEALEAIDELLDDPLRRNVRSLRGKVQDGTYDLLTPTVAEGEAPDTDAAFAEALDHQDMPVVRSLPPAMAVRAAGGEPRARKLAVAPVLEVIDRDGLPAAFLSAIVAARATTASEIEVRVQRLDAPPAGWWVRAYRPDGVLLAVAPLRRIDDDEVARLLVPPEWLRNIEVDITDTPGIPRPGSLVRTVTEAIAAGRQAARAERLGRRREAEQAWTTCADHWIAAGDPAPPASPWNGPPGEAAPCTPPCSSIAWAEGVIGAAALVGRAPPSRVRGLARRRPGAAAPCRALTATRSRSARPVADDGGGRPVPTMAATIERLIAMRGTATTWSVTVAVPSPWSMMRRSCRHRCCMPRTSTPRRSRCRRSLARRRGRARSTGSTPNASSQLRKTTSPGTRSSPAKDARSLGNVMRTRGASSSLMPSIVDASAQTWAPVAVDGGRRSRARSAPASSAPSRAGRVDRQSKSTVKSRRRTSSSSSSAHVCSGRLVARRPSSDQRATFEVDDGVVRARYADAIDPVPPAVGPLGEELRCRPHRRLVARERCGRRDRGRRGCARCAGRARAAAARSPDRRRGGRRGRRGCSGRVEVALAGGAVEARARVAGAERAIDRIEPVHTAREALPGPLPRWLGVEAPEVEPAPQAEEPDAIRALHRDRPTHGSGDDRSGAQTRAEEVPGGGGTLGVVEGDREALAAELVAAQAHHPVGGDGVVGEPAQRVEQARQVVAERPPSSCHEGNQVALPIVRPRSCPRLRSTWTACTLERPRRSCTCAVVSDPPWNSASACWRRTSLT